jgi:hypothetical protein
MSGGLRHHSDEASGPELCGWIQQSSKKDRYRLEPTSASALRASYATKLQKQSSIYLDIADVVRDVEKGTKAVISANFCVLIEWKINNLHAAFSAQSVAKRVFQQPLLISLKTPGRGLRGCAILYGVVNHQGTDQPEAVTEGARWGYQRNGLLAGSGVSQIRAPRGICEQQLRKSVSCLPVGLSYCSA